MTTRLKILKSRAIHLNLTIQTIIISVFFSGRVFAAGSDAYCKPAGSSFLDFPTWYKYLNPVWNGTECQLSFKLDSPGDLGKIVLAIVEIMLRIGGIVAVGFVIYGGFQYILSQGDPSKAVSARHTIVNAIIGMVIALIATFIVVLVGGNLAK